MSEQNQPRESAPSRAERPRKQHGTPIFVYLAILFAAAFLMLLLAYFQQQRSNRESTEVLQKSASAVESIQLLMEDNEKLRSQAEEQKGRIAALEKELEGQKASDQNVQAQIDDLEKQLLAMQWFWQIESAYAKDRLNTTKELIEKFESTGLVKYLPAENSTGTQRFSPAARYQEIYDALY